MLQKILIPLVLIALSKVCLEALLQMVGPQSASGKGVGLLNSTPLHENTAPHLLSDPPHIINLTSMVAETFMEGTAKTGIQAIEIAPICLLQDVIEVQEGAGVLTGIIEREVGVRADRGALFQSGVRVGRTTIAGALQIGDLQWVIG